VPSRQIAATGYCRKEGAAATLRPITSATSIRERLFEDNYKVKPIVKSTHLLHLCRYIHGNPVKDGLVTDPANWPYSNYLEWIGERNGKLYDPEFIQVNFGSPEEYRSFVFTDLRGRDLPDEIKKYLDKFGI
jgi:hypothetical protein